MTIWWYEPTCEEFSDWTAVTVAAGVKMSCEGRGTARPKLLATWTTGTRVKVDLNESCFAFWLIKHTELRESAIFEKVILMRGVVLCLQLIDNWDRQVRNNQIYHKFSTIILRGNMGFNLWNVYCIFKLLLYFLSFLGFDRWVVHLFWKQYETRWFTESLNIQPWKNIIRFVLFTRPISKPVCVDKCMQMCQWLRSSSPCSHHLCTQVHLCLAESGAGLAAKENSLLWNTGGGGADALGPADQLCCCWRGGQVDLWGEFNR